MARRRPQRKVYQHPLLIRITHWLNTIALTIMVLSGLRIFWAYQAFNLDSTVDPQKGYTAPALADLSDGLRFNLTEAPFDTLVPLRLSQDFYDRFTLGGWLAGGLRWHFTFMWLYVFTGAVYLGYSLISRTYRTLLFRPRDIRNLWPMVTYYLRLRRQPPPFEKYNPLQRLAYTLIVLAGVLSVLTGIVLYKPVQLEWLTRLLGGYQYTRLGHFLLVWIFVAFLVVHLIMVALSGWSNFVSMLTGWKTERQGASAAAAVSPAVPLATSPPASAPTATPAAETTPAVSEEGPTNDTP